MDKVKLLESHYNNFINLTDTHAFLLALVDYVEFTETVPEFERVSAQLIAKRKEEEDKITALHTKAIEKIDECRN